MPRTIARWTGTQMSLSAMTRATPSGSSIGVTGWMRFPISPRIAPAIAEPPPILNTHRSPLALSGVGAATWNVPPVVATVALLVASRIWPVCGEFISVLLPRGFTETSLGLCCDDLVVLDARG